MTSSEGPDSPADTDTMADMIERPAFLEQPTPAVDQSVYDEWRAVHGIAAAEVIKHGGPGPHRTSGTPQTIHSGNPRTRAGARAEGAENRATGRAGKKSRPPTFKQQTAPDGRRTEQVAASKPKTKPFTAKERSAHAAKVKARRKDTQQAERETAAGELVTARRAPRAPKKPAPAKASSGGKQMTRDELADMAQTARRHNRTIDMASRRSGDPKADSARKKAESAVRDLEARAKKALPSDVTRRGTLIDWVAEMDRRRAIDLGASGSA